MPKQTIKFYKIKLKSGEEVSIDADYYRSFDGNLQFYQLDRNYVPKLVWTKSMYEVAELESGRREEEV